MLPLTKEELKSNQDAKPCHICGKRILRELSKSIDYRKVRDHCHYTGKHRGAARSISNLKVSVPVDFHIKLANAFEGKFECFGENTKKAKLFPVRQKKKLLKSIEDGNENVATISYKIEFVDSARFMATSLSNLVDNLTEGIHKIKCKDCNVFLEYESVNDNFIKCKYLSCNKDYSNKICQKLNMSFT